MNRRRLCWLGKKCIRNIEIKREWNMCCVNNEMAFENDSVGVDDTRFTRSNEISPVM